jgi:hypothetical protein
VYQLNRIFRSRWLLLAALWAFSGGAAAGQPEESLLGTWQGELVVNPSTKVTVQFIVRRDAPDKYSAVLNTPGDANLQNIPVSTFNAGADKVVFVVNDVGGRYEGTLRDHRITGKWQQNGVSFDLALAPYVKPRIPAAIAAHLNGPWHGVLSVPTTDMKVPMVVNFKVDPNAASGMTATIDSPSQGASGIPAEDVSLVDGELSLTSVQLKMGFSGRIGGDEIVGRWIQGGSAPLTLTRGQYLASGVEVAKPIRQELKGDWYGQSGGIGIAFRFKEEPDGRLSAFLDRPYEGRRGMRLDRVSVTGSRISLGDSAIGMTFDGTLTADAISGKFVNNGQARDLTLKRGEYVPETLRLAPDLAGRLVGKWAGATANNTEMILRIQRDEHGDLVAVQDIPSRQMFAIPVTGLDFDGQSIKLTVRGIAAEFTGKLANNELSGDWIMPSLRLPLRLSRVDR